MPNGVKEVVFTGLSVARTPPRPVLALALVPAFDPAVAMGCKSGKANTATSAGLPGPGAVMMLSRPVEKSTKPVATLTPDRLSPYGLKDANRVGPLPDDDASGT